MGVCEHTLPLFGSESRIFIFFFYNYGKASFHCTYLSKRRQIFAAVHNSMFKIQQRSYFFIF